ncbi:MAG TPA: NfeD family protein [Candidatus Tectomicrobia bacterium]|nr:NfeD family protein [Candidatus Tectomicrobia bacterium]
MPWWLWVLIGLALLGAELFTPGGFYVLFFGVGAILVGILVGVGLVGPPWTEWLLFSIASIASLVLFRRRLLALTRAAPGQPPSVDRLEGEVAIPIDDIAPGAVGKAELRGTSWEARNADTATLTRGQRCRVARVENLTLWIRAE